MEYKIGVRFRGPDETILKGLAGQAMDVIRQNPMVRDLRTDWRQQVHVLRPQFSESRARQVGVSRHDLLQALQWTYGGTRVGIFREDDELIPIISRPPADERKSVGSLEDIQVWSGAYGSFVPLSNVVDGSRLVWEDPLINRHDRQRAISVECNPISGTAETLRQELTQAIGSIQVPLGYSMTWTGEYQDSAEAQEPLQKTFPLCLIAMFLTVVLLFNSIRKPIIVFLSVPLSLIGVSGGMVLSGIPFGFMSILGFLGLSGMLIKNAIVLIDELEIQIKDGKDRYLAILDSSVVRLRPVVMAAGTTVLGMAPLLFDPMYSGMSVTIMGGLFVGTFLTMIMVPVFYCSTPCSTGFSLCLNLNYNRRDKGVVTLLWKIFLAFFKTGLLGFGGGAAIAPAMHKEAVEKYRWVKSVTFSDILALSNTLPGPAAPQMAAVIGYRAGGIWGAVMAVFALVGPVAVLVVALIWWIFSTVGDSADKLLILQRSTVAVFPLVSAMLCLLMAKFFKQSRSALGTDRTIFFSVLCLILLSVGVDNGFVILAMISLAITASAPWPRFVREAMVVPVAIFLLIHSDLPVNLDVTIPWWLSWGLVLFMVIMGARGLWITPALPSEDVLSSGDSGPGVVMKDVGKMWLIVLILLAPLFILSPFLLSVAYLGLLGGMIFTGLMTFGGGPVFIPLAIDLLAGPSSQVFLYSKERLMQYIAIVNALPSPIITKLSAISGWDMVQSLAGTGLGVNGIKPIGVSMSPLGVGIWAGVGGAILVLAMVLPAMSNALVAFSCFDRIKRSPGMKSMTKFIMPILMSIFLSVFISFITTAIETIGSFPGSSTLWAVSQVVGLFALFLLLEAKKLVPDMLLIVGAVVYGLTIL
ncbi:efflux RND transporter permease subunit [Dethiosulfovibrio salsuginis]|uniref:efflux RND transporter permease subunit n=1 Tax=Dethiosulfovibrio salsuginis TaxID=561720 RepID=UPI0013564627|nr:efflux RND transporter permease subunit [Dethiosulfovibrio salsuginis]